jgi:hypothetical protein
MGYTLTYTSDQACSRGDEDFVKYKMTVLCNKEEDAKDSFKLVKDDQCEYEV